jgi:hypothetical protein
VLLSRLQVSWPGCTTCTEPAAVAAYLADRKILIDQPQNGIFAAFEDAWYKIESDQVVQSREMYSAIYPATECDEQAALCLIENVDWFIPPLYRRL